MVSNNEPVIHASLINDLFYYNFEWLMNVLKHQKFEVRKPSGNDVLVHDLSKYRDVKIWTYDLRGIKKKMKKLKGLGYNIEVIQMIGYSEEIFTGYLNPANTRMDRFRKIMKSELCDNVNIDSMCYGVIYRNDYTTIDMQIGYLNYLYDSLKEKPKKLYLDFNVNEGLRKSKRLNANALSEEERERFKDEVKGLVEKGTEVYEKPSYFGMHGDVDLGLPNFCWSYNILGEGMLDIRENEELRRMHYPNQLSLILRQRPGETKTFAYDLLHTKNGHVDFKYKVGYKTSEENNRGKIKEICLFDMIRE